MTQPQHTPWRLDATPTSGGPVLSVRTLDDEPVASVLGGNVERGRLLAAAPDLLTACKAAMEHVTELREAWRAGDLMETAGSGGTRSNRNVRVETLCRKAIAAAEGAK